jgi:outer membrane usher protein
MDRRLIPALVLLCPVAARAQSAPEPPAKDGSSQPAPSSSATPTNSATSAKAAQERSNPYGRAIDLTVDVDFYKRSLGEVTVHMAADGATTFDGPALAAVLKPLLSNAAQTRVDAALAGQATTLEELKKIGIDAIFDRENVAISIRSIDPNLREPLSIYGATNHDSELATNASPAAFSFFLDTTVSESRDWSGPTAGFRDPSIFLNSAIRAGPIVLEGEGQIADRDPFAPDRQYRFDRNYVRLVYDLPDDYLRTYVGDLTPEVRFEQNYVQMGGIGISRERRRFDQFRTAVLQGDHQLILQRESTVQVYRNGILFQQLQLEPGSYDLSNLPLLSGSNDIRLAVQDASGFSQTINYQTYLDPIDLEPGDWEGALYVGKLSTTFGLSPKYDGQLAVTGFYRKSFVDHPAIGFGLQASQSVQQLSAQTQLLIGSGRLDATVGASRSKLGNGYLAGLVYELLLDQSERSTSVTIEGVWHSRYFTGLGAALQDNSSELNASAIVSHTFNPLVSMEAGATYIHNRLPLRDGYRIYTQGYYRISRKWFVSAGVDYQQLSDAASSKRQNGVGFNVSLVFRPNIEDRAEARYDYHYDSAQLSYEHFPETYVGAVGYGALISHSQGQDAAEGFANYTGNNFDASLTQSISGPGFGQLAQRKVTTARISTAIAFADGAFAVTPRIGDSFAILEPHQSLRGHNVVLGDLLTDSRYRSISGPLGGAVDGYLSSYVTQSINYDVENPPPGYDVGLGIFRVHPPYHSGYKLIVGSEAYVTATGTLLDAKAKPVALGSGQVIDLSRPKDKAIQFFTNSVGRFALTNLRPNNHYQVKLYSGPAFEFTVPANSAGLVDLHLVTIPSDR